MFARNPAFKACLFLPVLLASPALANDTTAQLAAGGLVFTRSFDIEMAREDLYISPDKVEVNYVFHNTSDKDVTTLVAFPMPVVGGNPNESNVGYDNYDVDNWMNFQVGQDGEAIEPQLQQRATVAGIDMTDELVKNGIPLLPFAESTAKALEALPQDVQADWVSKGLIYVDEYDAGNGMERHLQPTWQLSTVYYWQTTFPAGADVKVHHTYKPSVGGTVATIFLDENNQPRGPTYDEYVKKYCIDDNLVKIARQSNENMVTGKPFYAESWISYILTTGANWGGTIKDFTLTIDKGKETSFVSFCGDGVKKVGPTTFQMKKTDFYPEKDIEILILNLQDNVQ